MCYNLFLEANIFSPSWLIIFHITLLYKCCCLSLLGNFLQTLNHLASWNKTVLGMRRKMNFCTAKKTKKLPRHAILKSGSLETCLIIREKKWEENYRHNLFFSSWGRSWALESGSYWWWCLGTSILKFLQTFSTK